MVWTAPVPSELSSALRICSAKHLLDFPAFSNRVSASPQVISGEPSPSWINVVFGQHALFVPERCISRKEQSPMLTNSSVVGSV